MARVVLAGPDLCKYIDHTDLKPETGKERVKTLCYEAKLYGFKSVCVNLANIAVAARELAGSDVAACCTVGFPLGATLPEIKADEARAAIVRGAKEVDMVVNIGAVKAGEWDLLKSDIAAVVSAARGEALVKVIIETCLLSDVEKIKTCLIAKEAGADFVKTSTGFSTGGATPYDVRLMRETVGPDMGVKASGGIKTCADATAMIHAGANRLGTSAGVEIVRGSAK